MELTPKTAKVLSNCLLMHSWQQGDLAALSKIHPSVVSLHVRGTRPIRDDHLSAYLPCLDAPEQRDLLAAWLQDVLPQSVQEHVLEPTGNRLNAAVTTFALGLTLEQQDMLRFWAEKIAVEDDLAAIFAAITRKAGHTATATAGTIPPMRHTTTTIGGRQVTLLEPVDRTATALNEPPTTYKV